MTAPQPVAAPQAPPGVEKTLARPVDLPGSDPGADLRSAVQRKGSFLQTMKAVSWSFFGVRKSAEYEKDISQLNPVHVVIAGVLGAVIFIAVLLTLVDWVLSSGVAAS